MEVEPGINAIRLPKIYFGDPVFHRSHQEAGTLKTTLQVLAEDIALGLARELRSHQVVAESTVPKVIDQFVDQVAQEVVGRLGNGDLAVPANAQRLLQRLEQVESRLEKLTSGIRSALQQESVTGPPVPVGEGSKYQNVESLLKYIETPDGEGGLKLVIMNFND